MTTLSPLPAYITSFGTALPSHRFDQVQIAGFMADALRMSADNRRRLNALYRSTKISSRYSVLPDYGKKNGDFSFYPNTPDLEPFPGVGQRMALYKLSAPELASEAILDCLKDAEVDLSSITHLITVSCTGMYAPGLDIELITRLGLPPSLRRVAVNFMGCYGAFNGLKTAAAFVKADPTAKVVMVSVELCTIHFQKKDEEDHLLANALFADGAAAVLIEGTKGKFGGLELVDFDCALSPDGKEDMAWNIGDFGFEMKLTPRVPELIKKGFPDLVDRLLQKNDAVRGDVSHYAIHPGGRRILEVVENVLDLPSSINKIAYEVLARHGNMSSATILFILKTIWEQRGVHNEALVVAAAFGPGLTTEMALLRFD